MSRIKLSVIIVAYKNKEILDDCIKSINKYNDAPSETEIIIIDNSPDDVVYNYVNTTYSEIIIKKSDNRGFGAGNNEGVKISTGDYLLFLNPDTILLEPIFKFAIEKFENDKNLGIFGVQLLNRERKKTFSYFFIDRFDFASAVIQRCCNKMNIFLEDCMHIHGADMFIRKNMFVEAGMFDENIFMYEEEPDITKRIKHKFPNTKVRYYSNKTMVHLEGSSSPGFEGQCDTIHRLMKAETYYCKKYGIDLEKRVKQRVQYIRLKLFFYLIFNRDKALQEKEYINIYESYLK